MLSKEFVAKTRHMKGFTITFQWVNGEPAMCLLRSALAGKSAWVICLSSAYKYADLGYLIPTCNVIAAHFGMDGERHAARNIADIILEHIEDLVRMKPEPTDAEKERGEGQVSAEFDEKNRIITLH